LEDHYICTLEIWNMNFIEELRWRGMLHDATPGVEDVLNSKKVLGYIGFDPTAPSMTIGNYVQLMLLKLFQLSGHTPIVLMGGATGRIGDPSGKDKERQLKSYEELDRNLEFQKKQAMKFLDFEGPNAAIVINNHDFYKDMNILDFLRNVGKTLTVNYMMSKDSVKNRLETGLSFTEFSYQLLQAYDFQCLFEKYGCILQMGGSDQWGNITSGTEFIRRNTDGKAYAVTTPLLTKSDGKKFGKSESGNIWLDPKMTSPYKFYQFWISADDADLPKFMRYFTLKSKEEVEALEEEYASNPRDLKKILAEELTRRIHGDEAYEAASTTSELLFGKKATQEELLSLSREALDEINSEIPSFILSSSELGQGTIEVLAGIEGLFTSKSDARRAIKGNAISINKIKVNDENMPIDEQHLLRDKYIFLENGKKNKIMIRVEK
jgi:tyrosyl-tRNA synthetase